MFIDRRSSSVPETTDEMKVETIREAKAKAKVAEAANTDTRYVFVPVVGVTVGVMMDISSDPPMELGSAIELQRKDTKGLLVPHNEAFFQKRLNKVLQELRKSSPWKPK